MIKVRMGLCALLYALTTAGGGYALTSLSGIALGVLPRGDYLVSGTLSVPPGETFRISAGCRLYFENFSGIVVDGSLVCAGTVDSPVVLTSRNAYGGSASKAAPFDWNGVEVNAGANEVRLNHTTLSYSTIGLKISSVKTKVACENVTFRENGANTFRRGERPLLIMDNVPVSFFCSSGSDSCVFGQTGAKPSKKEASNRTVAGKHSHRQSQTPKKGAWRVPIRLTLAVGAAGGVAMWISGHIAAQRYQHEYEKALPQDVTYWRKRRENAVVVRNIGIVGTGLFVPALTISFFF